MSNADIVKDTEKAILNVEKKITEHKKLELFASGKMSAVDVRIRDAQNEVQKTQRKLEEVEKDKHQLDEEAARAAKVLSTLTQELTHLNAKKVDYSRRAEKETQK